jgi:hypothetical protein
MIRLAVSLLVLFAAVHCSRDDVYVDDEIACGEDKPSERYMNETSPGIFSSPNWNSSYPSNSRCEWNITTEPGEVIELRFIDFQVEYCTGCKCDALEVYDGPDTDSDLLGVFCWMEFGDPGLPEYVTSTGNEMYAVFRSDDSGNYRGFLMRYAFPYTSNACTFGRPEYKDEEYGNIMSPNWPADYPNNAFCTWHLHAAEGKRMRIVFAQFEIEDGCYDYLEVFDGTSASSPRIGRYFGENDLPPTMVSSGQDMFLSFESDSSITFTGFYLGFQQEDNI